MIGHLPAQVLREVAVLAGSSGWRYETLMCMPHLERRMWHEVFADVQDQASGARQAGEVPW
jgi:hypothetical protein